MKSLYWSQTVLALLLFSTPLAAQPPQIGGYNVYYGNLHNHSEVSDGIGTPDEAYNYAKNTSHLDFFGLSDHSDGSGDITPSEWIAMKTAADAYNEPGVFTSFRGFEWTTYTYGHLTVVNSENYCYTEPPVLTFTDLCNWLNERECIAFFNHPGYADKEDKEFFHFATPPSNKIIGMELWTSIRDFSIYYYNDGYYVNDGTKGYFDEALMRNWKIGALGNEDNHSGIWGNLCVFRMAILANANTREELYNAMKLRRFYSTLDKNLALSFQINGNEMGSTVLPGTYGVRIRASDADGELFTQVQLLNNGTVVNTWTPNSGNPDITSTITFANNQYYYVKVKQTDGNEAISSPIWISDSNQFPIISILSPSANQVFLPPATVPITVSASDNDGTVARVDFFQGSTFLGSDTTSPFSFNWTNVASGTYTLTAKATDNTGATTNSLPVAISVNQPPIVSISSPASGATFNAPASVTLTASASDPDGTITKVDFYQGSTLLNSDSSSPYSFNWTNVAAGNYSLTAKATDNSGSTTVSNPVTITVSATNQSPVVSLTSPTSGATFNAPASVTLTASASDPDGTITKVDFYQGSTLLNSDSSSPYSFNWTNVVAGNYTLTAKATDNSGATTVSNPVTITVSATNQPPVVSLTSPTPGATFNAPASVTLTASASDPDGTITKVEFYYGSNLITSDNQSPYSYTVTGVPASNYTLTAKATDNNGITTMSAPVTISVVVPGDLPVVSITSPVSGATFTAPATVLITASASDADGIAKVDFYYGGAILGSDNTSPYSYTQNNVPAGSYTITAMATDNTGASKESTPVTFTVGSNLAPFVSISSPVSGAIFTAPATIVFSASASDADGTIAEVDFYHGTTLLYSDNASPYSFTWTNVANGSYTLTAKAVDNSGVSTISSPVVITVGGSNQPPVVSITTPLQGATFTSPATITLIASATDNDGTISKVEFYYGSTLLSTDITSPYSYTATNVGVGNYTISAKATDNAGAYALSQTVDFSVIAESEVITFTKRILTGSDDVEESATGVISLNSDDIELVYDTYTTGNQIVGLRFNGVTVPQGATVTSAFITFTVDETDNGTCNLVIKGEKTGNAQQFTTSGKNVSNRTKTTASVTWSPTAWQIVGVTQSTPNLESIIQEIIGSAVWNSGNSMVFIITGSGTRTAESFEGGAAKAALLTINYSVNTLKSGKLNYRAESIPQIETSVKTGNFSCYPVPFTFELHIDFIPGEGEYVRNIEIVNSTGHCVMYTTQNENQSVLDMQNLTPGVYIVRIRSNLGTYNKVVLKN